jgi:hypothetical protein
VVLVFETIDAADEPTIATLIQILQRPGWLRLPLVFTLRGTPQGRVTELVTLLRREEATHAVMEIAGNTPSHELSGAFAWTALPPDVLRVLRAGAVLGSAFDAEIIAQLLDIPLATVLEKLQVAADAGGPLIDRGERRFTLPATAVEQLQGGMLPSLLTFWHARLGALFSGGHAAEDTAVVPEPRRAEAADTAVPHSMPEPMVTWPEELFEVSTPHATAEATASQAPRRDAAVATPAWHAELPRAEPAPGVAARAQAREPQRTEGRTDLTRAAAH